jgi:endoglucanase
MRRLTGCALAALAWVAMAACRPHTPPQDTPPMSTPAPAVDAFAANRRLGRGVNLGNALEAPSEGEWGVTLREADFQLIAEAGFDSVRLPTRWSAHAGATAPYAIDPAFFDRVTWAVDQALARGLNVVLNIHHYDELLTDRAAQEPRFLAIWRQIAERFQDYPDALFFEVLNEPHDIGDRAWNTLAAKALDVIRASNPARYVIVGPVDWNSHRRLRDLRLPEDDRRLIVTFHYYLPFQFTHQGAEWAEGSQAWLGTTWDATSSQKSDALWDLDLAAAWGKEHNRPIFLGEFGAYSKADMDSRARWTAFVARQAEARDMSWAYWEFRAGFGVYDDATGAWNQPLLDALMP